MTVPQIVRAVVKAVPQVLEYLSADTLEVLNSHPYQSSMKASGDYQAIRDAFWTAVYDAVDSYLSGGGSITSYKNAMKQAVASAYNQAGDIGYVDGGGELPVDPDTADWITAEQAAQLGFVDSLFQTLKELRAEGDANPEEEAADRANGYSNSLDYLYNSAKLRGAKNKMYTFDGSDGKESCKDCQKYKGQRHRASWWVAHDAVPPNRSFECAGYNCEHYLVSDDGERFTI